MKLGSGKNSYAFVLFQSVRTSKIGDELLVFTDSENVLCLGNVCCRIPFSLY